MTLNVEHLLRTAATLEQALLALAIKLQEIFDAAA